MQQQILIKLFWFLKKGRDFILVLFILIFSSGLNSQNINSNIPVLSESSSVSLLTCGSGYDLYSIFGHTSIRVSDPKNNMDVVFNYGTFQFSDDFYVQFVMGKLNYQLSVESFDNFRSGYQYENRWVIEQVLNLKLQQRKEVFNFLTTNYLPENREYLYDFFYDNCSTRPRDVFENILGDKLVYNFPKYDVDTNFHDMLDKYLQNMQWADCGMDLGLGKTADRILSERDKMFLPDYVLQTYDQTSIIQEGVKVPFVKNKRKILDSIDVPQPFDNTQPLIVFWGLLALYLVSFSIPFTRKHLSFLDLLLYFSAGIAGVLVLFLWFVTDHTTTQVNFNLLWTVPIYLLTFFTVFIKNKATWLRRFYLGAAITNILLLISWPLLPQDMNEVYIPVILILIWRNLNYSGELSRFNKSSSQIS
jgi:hypothetical protein